MSALAAPLNVTDWELADEKRQRKITAYYEREIQKGFESGLPIPVTPEFWNELNAEIEQAYHEKRKGATA